MKVNQVKCWFLRLVFFVGSIGELVGSIGELDGSIDGKKQIPSWKHAIQVIPGSIQKQG